jgi:aldose sugar dehydrogenase
LKKAGMFITLFLVLGIQANLSLSSLNGAENSNKSVVHVPWISDTLKMHKVFEGLKFPTSMDFLGPDDILVTEKNNGTVQRIVNGNMLSEPLLDANVSNYVERGLLGSAISKQKSANGNGEVIYVFLYYTETNNEGNVSKNEKNHDCTDCNPIGHRLYRYELKDNKLIHPKLLLNLPTSPGISGASHVGGAMVIGPDKEIYLTTGEGESCQNNSCIDGIENKSNNAQSSNVRTGQPPVGRGGILRISQDGQIDNHGILGHKYPLNLYYAYGIRNSFGIDFDPLTGKLWDTENGPGFGDEINLVHPGFNSGWIRMQGVWPIDDYNLLDSTPKEKGYFGKTELNKKPKNLVTFDGKGQYSNPEFTWNTTVGVTSIKFFNSDKLGKKYENDLFVGDTNHLYHFDLNSDRTGLSLSGKLYDKVANSDGEVHDSYIGGEFPTIVDLEISPDGYLYILSYDGSIYKITKNSQTD